MKPHILWCNTSVPCARFIPIWTWGSPDMSRGSLCTLNNLPKVHSIAMAWCFWAQYNMAKFLWRMDKYIR